MRILSPPNAKGAKNLELGYYTTMLQLAPATVSGYNVCAMSGECAIDCIFYSGHGVFPSVKDARINRTRRFFYDRAGVLKDLHSDIEAGERKARKMGVRHACRLNTFSDLRWERIDPSLFSSHSDTIFYDYTKLPWKMADFLDDKLPGNYELTYSFSERADLWFTKEVLRRGGNVSVVYHCEGLPEDADLQFEALQQRIGQDPVLIELFAAAKWLVNGDLDDCRFLDPAGSLVALYAKANAEVDAPRFVHILKEI
jgi:hypothetical protein